MCLDGVVYSAPVIQDKIGGGKATITGSFTMEEARDLAVVLRAGALPAPVKILEQRTVGPSLGKDSIDQGMLASLVGGIGIVLFMIMYYKIFRIDRRYRLGSLTSFWSWPGSPLSAPP